MGRAKIFAKIEFMITDSLNQNGNGDSEHASPDHSAIASAVNDDPVEQPDNQQSGINHQLSAKNGHPDHRGTGKVSRLPNDVRDQIGQMLLDGVPYKDIRERLGEPGKELTLKNISNWRTRGGFNAWLRDQRRLSDCRSRRELLKNAVSQDPGTDTYQASPKIAVALLSETLLDLGPDVLRKGLADDPRNAFRLLNSLARLISGGLRCEKLLLEAAAQKAEAAQKIEPAGKGLLQNSGTVLQDFI